MEKSPEKKSLTSISVSDMGEAILLIDERLKNTKRTQEQNQAKLTKLIEQADSLLTDLGIDRETIPVSQERESPRVLRLRSWDEIMAEASTTRFSDEDVFLFEKECLNAEKTAGKQIAYLRLKYDREHQLDDLDWGVSAFAGLLAGIVDVCLVGMPQHPRYLGSDASKGGPLSNYMKGMKEKLNEKYETVLKGLEAKYRTSFDASTSRDLKVYVSGLGPRTHRFQTLGHDPILGFIFGVFDIMTGRMTAIDKAGRIVSQLRDGFTPGASIFEAIVTVFFHLVSDATTAAGLPVPLMPLLQLIQVGHFGKNGQYTLGEVTRIMYSEGYDFSHFLAMSVCPMIIEVIIRVYYLCKRLHDGHSLKESLPFDVPRQIEKKPKLQTMLFTAHSVAAAINVGKTLAMHNPLAINYPELVAFGKTAFSQAKWALWQKEAERLNRVEAIIQGDWDKMDKLLADNWKFMDEE